VLDLSSGQVRRLTDGDHVGSPAWSPDGRTIAFTRRLGDDSDLTVRTAVYLLDVDDPKARPRVVALEDGIAGTVSYSRDGSSLLVRARLELPLLDLAAEEMPDPLPRLLRAGELDLAPDRLDPGLDAELRDPRAHRPEPDDSDLRDLHRG
jgi:dipeptidyl aminopeptidase/acylaminoacyl peptidase